jgi:hypothetical protein
MPRRPPSRPRSKSSSEKRRRKREAMRRWRKNARDGKRLAPTPVSALTLDWLQRHYPGACNLDDLADVGRLIGRILDTSARADL